MHLTRETKLSYVYLLKWIALSLVAGSIAPFIIRLFVFLMESVKTIMVRAGPFAAPVWIWPIIGASIAGLIIYRIQPLAAGEGIPSYIRAIRIRRSNFSFSVTFYKFWAALITLSTFGNGGIVGPLGRVTSGLMAFITEKSRILSIGMEEQDQRTAALCGMAGVLGTIFHSSIGGGIFAVEIIQRKSMGYRDLFPAILSSSTAVFLCKLLGWKSFYHFESINNFMDNRMIGWLIILCLITGSMGWAYTAFYRKVSKLFKRKEGKILPKLIIGSIIAFSIAWFVNPELLGTSARMIPAITSGDFSLLVGNLDGIGSMVIILIVLILCKAVCNCITVGSGMSAGFTGPAIIIGMLCGAAYAQILQVECQSPTYFAFLAVGFSGMLASSMNVPLSAAVLSVEIFGLQYSFPAALAAIIGFQLTRHQTIYEYALEEFPDTINTEKELESDDD